MAVQVNKKDSHRIDDGLVAALAACGYEVINPDNQLRIHSHCAGMDAVAWSIKKLGLSARLLVTESDPNAATFHMMHHCTKIDHIITDIKFVAEGLQGTCFKHGAKMCTWDKRCDLLFSSFVCKPYSTQNNKRLKSMVTEVGSDPQGVDTYHYTRSIIAEYQPRAFVLENVAGIAKTFAAEDDPSPTPKRARLSPADFMLKDLKSAGYEVALIRVQASEFAKMCQSRPRILFFGVRNGESRSLDSVVRLFNDLGKAYSLSRESAKIDDFLDAAAWGAAPKVGCTDEVDKSKSNVFEYESEYDKMFKAFKQPKKMSEDRPGDSVPGESARIRARIDALAEIIPKHALDCPKNNVKDEQGRNNIKTGGCRCHPVADVSQSASRVNYRVDGSIPTLTTRSRLFSYKMRRFISPTELAASMGYAPRCSLVPFNWTGAATLVGNGYCVPVCALAVAAAASVVGRVVPKTKTQTGMPTTLKFVKTNISEP